MRIRVLLVGAAVIACAVPVGGCSSSTSSDGVDGVSKVAAVHYAKLALPAERPEGLTNVRVEEYADPTEHSQRVRLDFDGTSVYLCSAERSSDDCPFPDKSVLRTTRSIDGVKTVYAVDAPPVEGKDTDPVELQRLEELIGEATMVRKPTWFVHEIDSAQN